MMQNNMENQSVFNEYEWHKSLLSTVEKAKEKGLVLYGAGFWGEIAYKLFDLFHVKPNCFCDDNSEKIGKRHCGIEIKSVCESIDEYAEAVYIVCIDETMSKEDWNRTNRNKMLLKLKEYGVYSSDCEIHLSYYVFLLDIGLECIKNIQNFPNKYCRMSKSLL